MVCCVAANGGFGQSTVSQLAPCRLVGKWRSLTEERVLKVQAAQRSGFERDRLYARFYAFESLIAIDGVTCLELKGAIKRLSAY